MANTFPVQVDSRLAIPLWAIGLTSIVNALLGLINIGSSTAFNAIISLVVGGYLSSYLVPIVLMIMKRIKGERIHFGPWTLGRAGLPINIFAACYTLVTVFFTFCKSPTFATSRVIAPQPPEHLLTSPLGPVSVPVNAVTMNWSCVVYGGTVILGIIYYVLRGHKKFVGPSTERLNFEIYHNEREIQREM